MTKTTLCALLATSVLIGAGTSVALAGGCNEYASQAVISASQNHQYGCGFHGLRWSPSYQVHYSWCRSVGYANAFPERIARAQAIRSCRG